MSILGVLSISFFYIVTFYVGFLAYKHSKKKENKDEQYLVAGRSLPLWLALGTMTATWVGGGYINGTAESVFTQGFLWTQAPWGYGLSLIIGGLIFAEPMRRRGYVSLLDPFQEKYGHKVASLLYLPAVTGDIFWSASVLAALGYTVSLVIGIDFHHAVILSACIAVMYTLLGGLLAVAYTDFIQLMFIIMGLGIVLPFALHEAGGLDAVIKAYSALSFEQNFHAWQWSDNAFLLIFGGIPWGVYFQRILACKSPSDAKKLSIWAGIICFLFAVPPALIGMVGAVTDWPSIGLSSPEGSMILPYIFKYLTPEWVGLIGASVIAAAVMSSVDSSILSSAYMFVWNVYAPFKKNPPKSLTFLIQICVIVIGALATILALKVKSVYALWYLCSDLVYVVLFPQLVMVLFFPHSNAKGAICGFFVAVFLRFLFGEETLGLPEIITANNFPFRTLCMISSLGTIFFVSIVTTSEQVLENYE